MKTLFAVLAITALMTMSAMALGNDILKANVPFDFVVNGKHLPAGDYYFTRSVAPAGIQIRAKDGADSVFVVYQPGAKNTTGFDGAVSFSNYGETHFLREVWFGGSVDGLKLPQTKAEKEMLSRTATRTAIAASISR